MCNSTHILHVKFRLRHAEHFVEVEGFALMDVWQLVRIQIHALRHKQTYPRRCDDTYYRLQISPLPDFEKKMPTLYYEADSVG